jgi:sterol desaturase/sphingolipid hydroxylase (fatty acid hydroxylase superfamily)
VPKTINLNQEPPRTCGGMLELGARHFVWRDTMTASQYSLLSAPIFTLVAVLQLVRAIGGWSVTVGTAPIPIWVSYVACVVAAVLVWFGFAASQA